MAENKAQLAEDKAQLAEKQIERLEKVVSEGQKRVDYTVAHDPDIQMRISTYTRYLLGLISPGERSASSTKS